MAISQNGKITKQDVIDAFETMRNVQGRFYTSKTASLTITNNSKIRATTGKTDEENVIARFRAALNGLTSANMSNSAAKNPDTALTGSPAIRQPVPGDKILTSDMYNVILRMDYLTKNVTGCSCVSHNSTCAYDGDVCTFNGTNNDNWGGPA